MTIDELAQLLAQKKEYALLYLALIPLLSIALRLLHGKYNGKRSPWKYTYSVLLYLSCIPGIFSLVITAYSLLFLHANMLEIDVITYFLPILSMVLTLAIVRRSIEFNNIPGIDRIYGFLTLIGLAFIITIVLDGLRVFVLFRGSVFALLVICAAIYILLRYGVKRLFGRIKKRRGY